MKRCNPADPSTEHSDVVLRDEWILANGVERRTKGKATYFVCPNRAEMGRRLFPTMRHPEKRMWEIDRHGAERLTLDSEFCGVFVDMQRKNEAGKTISVYCFHDAQVDVQWFLTSLDYGKVVQGLLQRRSAIMSEESRVITEVFPVLLHHAMDTGNFNLHHIVLSAIEEHRMNGVVRTETWAKLTEMWSV